MARTAAKLKPPPLPEIDWDRVGKMLEAGATLDGVLAMVGVSQPDLFAACLDDNRTDFLTFAQQRRAKGDELLRIKQFQLAMSGDKSMLRLLGRDRGAAVNKTVPAGQSELLSISEISVRCDIDRAVCKRRLDALGYVPEAEEAKLKLYRFDAVMDTALRGKINDAYTDARLRDVTAAAELKEIKLRQARGELVPMGEVIEFVQKLGVAIYQEFTIRQGKRIDTKLAKAKSVIEVKKIRKADADGIMKRLRANFEEFVG